MSLSHYIKTIGEKKHFLSIGKFMGVSFGLVGMRESCYITFTYNIHTVYLRQSLKLRLFGCFYSKYTQYLSRASEKKKGIRTRRHTKPIY